MKPKFPHKQSLPGNASNKDKPVGPGGSGSDHAVADADHSADPTDFPEAHEDPAQSAELERQQDA